MLFLSQDSDSIDFDLALAGIGECELTNVPFYRAARTDWLLLSGSAVRRQVEVICRVGQAPLAEGFPRKHFRLSL